MSDDSGTSQPLTRLHPIFYSRPTMWRHLPLLRTRPLHQLTRWVVLVLMALVLGVLAPNHQHLALPLVGQTGHAEGTHQSLAECCLGLQNDPAEPECALCDFKARTPLVPAPTLVALPLIIYPRPFTNVAARAPPGLCKPTCRSRAPPTFLAHPTFCT